MNLDPALLEKLIALLGDDNVSTAVDVCESASRDYAWLSPVLTEKLPETYACAVVFPETSEAVQAILNLAYEYDVPVTPRSKGTGNYGQAVPLREGLVMDMSKLNKILSVREGWIEAQAGVNFIKLEAEARKHGQELAIYPSTINSYLAGFICGGAGGTGSVENGFVWSGNVGGMTIAPCCEDGVLFQVEGEVALPYIHAYGTTGFVAEAELRLCPAREWTAVYCCFEADAWEAATEAGLAVMNRYAKPRLLSIDQPKLTEYFPAHDWIPPGKISLRMIVEVSEVPSLYAVIDDFGGNVLGVDAHATKLLTLLSYNHVTLRAKQADSGICHIQVGGEICMRAPEQLCSVLPDSRLHLDGMKVGDSVGYGGLLISQFVDEATLYQGMDTLREMGCYIVDPHTWMLGAGHFPPMELVEPVAKRNDPKGLLNPGKLPAPVAIL